MKETLGVIGVIVIDILLGALIGWVAGKLVGSKTAFWKDAIFGVVGMMLGNLVSNLLKVSNAWVEIIVCILCAVVVFFIYHKISKK